MDGLDRATSRTPGRLRARATGGLPGPRLVQLLRLEISEVGCTLRHALPERGGKSGQGTVMGPKRHEAVVRKGDVHGGKSGLFAAKGDLRANSTKPAAGSFPALE